MEKRTIAGIIGGAVATAAVSFVGGIFTGRAARNHELKKAKAALDKPEECKLPDKVEEKESK